MSRLGLYDNLAVMAGFKSLIVWQKSKDLSIEVYKLTKQFPSSEQFGLSSQMRRAAVAIPSNIAEGYRRNNRKEYRQFCGIALGSAAELETQLIITNEIYPQVNIDVHMLLFLCEEVEKMLSALITKL